MRGLLVCSVVALVASCSCTKSKPARERAGATADTAARPAQVAAPTAMKPGVWSSLLEGAPRAELDCGGLLADLGTADQHKYTRGGWLSGWGDAGAAADGTTFAEAADERTRLFFQGTPPREVAVRLRSDVANQKVTLALNGTLLGHASVGPAWSVVTLRVKAPAATHDEPLVLELKLARQGTFGARAEVDWVWLRTDRGRDAPCLGPRVTPLKLDSVTRRALPAPTPRRYAFYVLPPAQATLALEYGSRVATRFVVRAQRDGGPPVELLRATATPGHWRTARVSLAAFAGRALRLDLTTEGPAGDAGWGDPKIEGITPRPAAPTGRPARNAIIIVLDAVRADLMRSLNPASAAKLPTLERLAREGTVFTNAYANMNWTGPSATTILSGLYPMSHGVRGGRDTWVLSGKVTPTILRLPSALRPRQFFTATLSTNPNIGRKMGFGAAFDETVNWPEDTGASIPEATKVTGRLYDKALAVFEERRARSRIFMYVHTMGGHDPYRGRSGCTMPRREHGFAAGSNEARTVEDMVRGQPHRFVNWPGFKPTAAGTKAVRRLYLDEVECEDRLLGAFLEKLAARGLLDETLVIVTADHGEELFDHGLFGHGRTLYEATIKVPLIMRYPPLFPAGEHRDGPVELIDLAPTVFAALGVAPPAFDGMSLLAPDRIDSARLPPAYAVAEHRPVHAATAIRVGPYKYVVADEANEGAVRPPWVPADHVWPPRVLPPGAHLYDLQADPGEHTDRQRDLPIARRLCEILLGEGRGIPHKASRPNGVERLARPSDTAAVTLDPQLRRQLEALGYLGSTTAPTGPGATADAATQPASTPAPATPARPRPAGPVRPEAVTFGRTPPAVGHASRVARRILLRYSVQPAPSGPPPPTASDVRIDVATATALDHRTLRLAGTATAAARLTYAQKSTVVRSAGASLPAPDLLSGRAFVVSTGSPEPLVLDQAGTPAAAQLAKLVRRDFSSLAALESALAGAPGQAVRPAQDAPAVAALVAAGLDAEARTQGFLGVAVTGAKATFLGRSGDEGVFRVVIERVTFQMSRLRMEFAATLTGTVRVAITTGAVTEARLEGALAPGYPRAAGEDIARNVTGHGWMGFTLERRRLP